VSRPA
ncbi:hypothetical protein CICLE_v100216821mg, partial [Citrus x clementina]